MGLLGLGKRNKNFKQGFYYPKNKDKFIGKTNYAIYRSGLELSYFRILDDNPNVLKWGSEEIHVPYFFDKKWHNYFIDIFVILKSDNEIKKYLIELKPFRQTIEPKFSKRKKKETYIMETYEWAKNQAKWNSAREFASKQNCIFAVLSEKDLNNYKDKK